MEFNKKQKKAIKAATNPKVKSVFITGAGGTGKTEIIHEIVKSYSPSELIVLAPTHSAAHLIGGETIHSFFKINMRLDTEAEKEEDAIQFDLGDAEVAEAKGKVLLIDEISMVGKKTLDNIITQVDVKKLILVGDLEQLRPVKEVAVKWGIHCDVEIHLEENYRTSNPKVLEAISHFREHKDNKILDLMPTVKTIEALDYDPDWEEKKTFIAHTNKRLSLMQEAVLGYRGAEEGDTLVTFGASDNHYVLGVNKRTGRPKKVPYFLNGARVRVTEIGDDQWLNPNLYTVIVESLDTDKAPIDKNPKYPAKVEVIVGDFDKYQAKLKNLFDDAKAFSNDMRKKYDKTGKLHTELLKERFTDSERKQWGRVWMHYLRFKSKPYARHEQFTTCYKAQGRSYQHVVAHWNDLNTDDLKYVAISRARESLTILKPA